MECCKFGEYRAHGHAPYPPAAWDGYAPYAAPYVPYSHPYYAPHAHDPYARYAAYRYEYPQPHHAPHAPHADHALPMDYGPYSPKEMRVRRAIARRDARSRTPVQHLALPPTPPLECGMNGRAPGYCEPPMWHQYQMGVMNGSSWNGAAAGGWASRSLSCSREQMRYPQDFRGMKVPHTPVSNVAYPMEGRSPSFSMFDGSVYGDAAGMKPSGAMNVADANTSPTERARVAPVARPAETRRSPPIEKAPVVAPLPAFQQAFGSTEIGKFAEAFSRTELSLDELASDAFAYDAFSEWEGPQEPHWSAQSTREIKCEDSF